MKIVRPVAKGMMIEGSHDWMVASLEVLLVPDAEKRVWAQENKKEGACWVWGLDSVLYCSESIYLPGVAALEIDVA